MVGPSKCSLPWTGMKGKCDLRFVPSENWVQWETVKQVWLDGHSHLHEWLHLGLYLGAYKVRCPHTTPPSAFRSIFCDNWILWEKTRSWPFWRSPQQNMKKTQWCNDNEVERCPEQYDFSEWSFSGRNGQLLHVSCVISAENKTFPQLRKWCSWPISTRACLSLRGRMQRIQNTWTSGVPGSKVYPPLSLLIGKLSLTQTVYESSAVFTLPRENSPGPKKETLMGCWRGDDVCLNETCRP